MDHFPSIPKSDERGGDLHLTSAICQTHYQKLEHFKIADNSYHITMTVVINYFKPSTIMNRHCSNMLNRKSATRTENAEYNPVVFSLVPSSMKLRV